MLCWHDLIFFFTNSDTNATLILIIYSQFMEKSLRNTLCNTFFWLVSTINRLKLRTLDLLQNAHTLFTTWGKPQGPTPYVICKTRKMMPTSALFWQQCILAWYNRSVIVKSCCDRCYTQSTTVYRKMKLYMSFIMQWFC